VIGYASLSGTLTSFADSNASGIPVLSCDADSGYVFAFSALHNKKFMVCWLPKDRRGCISVCWEHTLVIGANGGAVTILSCAAVIRAIKADRICGNASLHVE
jgi:hypothetical protein